MTDKSKDSGGTSSTNSPGTTQGGQGAGGAGGTGAGTGAGAAPNFPTGNPGSVVLKNARSVDPSTPLKKR